MARFEESADFPPYPGAEQLFSLKGQFIDPDTVQAVDSIHMNQRLCFRVCLVDGLPDDDGRVSQQKIVSLPDFAKGATFLDIFLMNPAFKIEELIHTLSFPPQSDEYADFFVTPQISGSVTLDVIVQCRNQCIQVFPFLCEVRE